MRIYLYISYVIILTLTSVTLDAQIPPSTFTYTINGDTCAPSSPSGSDSMYATFAASHIKSGVTYSWDFGLSGIPSKSGSIVDVYFKKCGTFSVTLTATDTGGTSSTSTSVTIKCRPKIVFSISDSMGCSPLTATLSVTSTGCSGTNKFMWYMGGLKYKGDTLRHSFVTICHLAPSLDIIDTFSNGCVAVFHKDTFVRISSVPNVSFSASANTNCKTPDMVAFTNSSKSGFGSCSTPLRYHWSFPNGMPSSSNDKSPTVIYDSIGRYYAKLVVTNIRTGCSDSLTKTQVVGFTNQKNINDTLKKGRADTINGKIYNTSGTFTDTLYYKSSGCDSLILNIHIAVITGINELKAKKAELSICPNPSDGHFNISIVTANKSDKAKVEVINILGQIINQADVYNNNGTIHATLSNTNLAKGVYLVRVKVGNESYIARLNITL